MIEQTTIIKELALLILDKYEKGFAVDSISNSELQNADDDKDSPLHKMALLIYKKDEISVAYGELLNKPERPILRMVGKVLSTAKNYFPAEVDSFLKKDATEIKFLGMVKYSAEILNFNPSGESLSDLFTHKFGNFLM